MGTTERVISIIARVTDSDEAERDPEVQLYKRGLLDSMGTVELLVELSREFDVALSPTEVDRELWATPTRIARYVESRLGA